MIERNQSPGKGDRDDDVRRAGESLRTLILAAEHYRQVVAAQTGLDLRQTQAISYLHTRGPMGQSELADALILNTGSVTSLVDRLEAHGLAVRRPHPTDRRRAVIELTEAGADIIRRSSTVLMDAFAAVDPARLGELTDLLTQLADGIRHRTDFLPPDR